MKRLTIMLAVLVCPLLIIACITVNIYFPDTDPELVVTLEDYKVNR